MISVTDCKGQPITGLSLEDNITIEVFDGRDNEFIEEEQITFMELDTSLNIQPGFYKVHIAFTGISIYQPLTVVVKVENDEGQIGRCLCHLLLADIYAGH